MKSPNASTVPPPDSPEPGQPSPQQMLKALQKSGYLFEHEIATALEKMGFYVERSYAYEDPDEGKSRELDIRAFRVALKNNMYSLEIGVHLYMECKDSESPFVFLQTGKTDYEKRFPKAQEYRFPARVSDADSSRMARYGLIKDHYYYSHEKKSVQFSKIIRKGSAFTAQHDHVYDALLIPQAKAFLDHRGRERNITHNKYLQEHIDLAFNVIVLRDHLFVLDLDEKEAEPRPAGRASFVRRIEDKNVNGTFLFDFVTQSYLETYITKEVGGFVDAIIREFNEHPMKFRSHGDQEEDPRKFEGQGKSPWTAGKINLIKSIT